MSQQGFQVTPEEDRFLRAFFRRQAGRYLAGAAVAFVVLWGVSSWVSPSEQAPEGWSHELVELRSANENLRAENQGLRAAIEELVERVESFEAAARQTGTLEKRVSDSLRRLERVESRVQKNRVSDATPSWDVGAVLERLDAVEESQRRASRGREEFEKGVLNRLYAVERSAPDAGSPSLPAAPAP